MRIRCAPKYSRIDEWTNVLTSLAKAVCFIEHHFYLKDHLINQSYLDIWQSFSQMNEAKVLFQRSDIIFWQC